eukprot:Blabericola_migrator_1__2643@NODE_174_length_12052_cov_318_013433_g151_i0_p9_GENE_NODE_174_length_12052_cov_318_013433_g151_i0NODE_174_length_12052_cov_318_013433_g151_i0_p9_ORF_typecomplete_len126_score14_68_NODE_174_length_12052_cov_318_013433_g151_i071847561
MAGLFNITGYGLQEKKQPKVQKDSKTQRHPKTQQRPRQYPIMSQDEVRVRSNEVRLRFQPQWTGDFWPGPCLATEVYLSRTIFEKHSKKFQTKKHIRHDPGTIAGLLVTPRVDPPPWVFTKMGTL